MVSVVTPVVECVRHENIVRALLGTLGLLTQGSCTTTKQALKVHEISTWEASLGHSSCHHWAMTHCHPHSALQLLRCWQWGSSNTTHVDQSSSSPDKISSLLDYRMPSFASSTITQALIQEERFEKRKKEGRKKMQKRCSAVLENAKISGYINCSH